MAKLYYQCKSLIWNIYCPLKLKNILQVGEAEAMEAFLLIGVSCFFFPLQQQEAPRFLAHFKGKFIIHKVQGPHIKLFSFTFGFILIKKIKREKQKPSNSLVVCSLFSNLLFLLKCVAQICSSYSQRWLFLRGQKGIRSYSYLKRPFCVNRERERNKTKGRKAKPNYTTSVQVEEYWPRE